MFELERGFTTHFHLAGFVVQVLVDLLLASVGCNEVSLAVAFVDLAGTHDVVDGVLNKLVPVSKPAGESGNSEHNSEHLSGDAESLVNYARVKVDVGVKLSADKVIVGEGNFLQLHSNINHRLATNNCEDILSDLANNLSTGVVILVNTVTEAHKDLLLVLDSLDESWDVLDVPDLLKHAQDSLVGTTVTGSVESSDGTGKRGINIGLR